MIQVEDIKMLPIVIKLISDFKRANIAMNIVETERLDETTVRVTLDFIVPPKANH